MIRRPGATLVEVLVAIFVTSLGLIGLIALFPVGTLSMARAIQNSRASQAAANANSIAVMQGLRADATLTTNFTTPPAPWPAITTAVTTADPTVRSYPIYVDPAGLGMKGYVTGSTSVSSLGVYPNTGAVVSPGIPRVVPAFIPAAATALGTTVAVETVRWLTLGDDFTFLPNGTPEGSPALNRERRYSWAYMLQQRPATSPLVTMVVVVYAARSPSVLGETSYQVDFAANTNTVLVNYGAAGLPRPNVRPGQWVLDATALKDAATPDPHGDFYRVVNITDVATGTVLLEFEQKIQRNSAAGFGVLCVMDGVVEVFNRGTN